MPFRALLIDDEKLARSRMRMLLEDHPDIAIIGEAANGAEAIAQVDRLQPDLLFLDIQMPEINGFQVLERIQAKPLVIFVTAYDAYALRAFEENALDYLLKPVEPERLQAAVEKLHRLSVHRADFDEALERLLVTLQPSYLTRLSVPVGDRTRLVKLEEVTHFSADNKYTVVHTVGQDYLISTSLTELERRLDPARFLRIHRSTIVNLDWVKEIYRFLKGKLRIVLNDPERTELDVGRSYLAAVRTL